MQRLLNLIPRLIFSHWTNRWYRVFVRNFQEHHDSGSDSYSAQFLFLFLLLAITHPPKMESQPGHNTDIFITIPFPTPWGKLHLGYAACHNKADSGFLWWLERPVERAPSSVFTDEIPFPF